MKLITLNTWGGRIFGPQVEFLRREALTADIFCFQEVYNGSQRLNPKSGVVSDMFSQYKTLLTDFVGIHALSGLHDVEGVAVPYGLALFYKKTLQVKETGIYEIFKLDEKLELPEGIMVWNRLLQYITIRLNDSQTTIFNLHGLYTGGGKDDGAARFKQSERVKNFMNQHSGEKILCGDFNLNPETKSLAMLAEGMRDLVKENDITSTRSHYYPKAGKFADYILVTPGIKVNNFAVLPDVVSDHLALVLEAEAGSGR